MREDYAMSELENTAPNKIWLNVGFGREETDVEFEGLSDVSWSEERISSADIEYVKKSKLKKEPDYWLYKGLIYKNGVTPFEGFRSWNKNLTREEFEESWEAEKIPLYKNQW